MGLLEKAVESVIIKVAAMAVVVRKEWQTHSFKNAKGGHSSKRDFALWFHRLFVPA